MIKSALFLFAIFRAISAIDNRLLYNNPSGVSTTEFQAEWYEACPAYQPAGYTYEGDLFEAGDFSGKNADSEARVYCTYTSADGTLTTFTTEVAEQLGATPVA